MDGGGIMGAPRGEGWLYCMRSVLELLLLSAPQAAFICCMAREPPAEYMEGPRPPYRSGGESEA